MSVKRYYHSFIMSGEMIESEGGDYVLHSDYASLLASHNALVEAVRWERECLRLTLLPRKYKKAKHFRIAVNDRNNARDCARAAVDTLIGEL